MFVMLCDVRTPKNRQQEPFCVLVVYPFDLYVESVENRRESALRIPKAEEWAFHSIEELLTVLAE
jgi:hypothetical protein